MTAAPVRQVRAATAELVVSGAGPEEMFVQLAGDLTSQDGTMRLDRVAPSNFCFSDRP